MNGATIYLIRHAEKPEAANGTTGIDEEGVADERSLTPRGWQRAGALAVWFRDSSNAERIERIYASRCDAQDDDTGSKSRRPTETVSPLAARTGVEVKTTYTKGGERELGKELATSKGVTLVCWQHEGIPAIALAAAPSLKGLPKTWPEERFDLVWILARNAAGAWTFDQRCQNVLEGDDEQLS